MNAEVVEVSPPEEMWNHLQRIQSDPTVQLQSPEPIPPFHSSPRLFAHIIHAKTSHPLGLGTKLPYLHRESDSSDRLKMSHIPGFCSSPSPLAS